MTKHPKALYLLFFTEMWERFSFYGMRGLLVIFCIASVPDGGLGWNALQAGQLYGLYTGAFYFTMLFGGYLADKYIGQQKSVMIGCVLIMFGHLCLAMQSIQLFYTGLVLLVIGGGFFKPNVSSLVGQLYPEGSPLKDSAYTIFYMGINIGSIMGILLCGYLGEHVGWHYGFGAAAVGMAIGLVIFSVFRNMLGDIGKIQKTELARNISVAPLTAVEKDRIWVIVFLSIFSIAFWMAFEQAGSSISIFALKYTDRELLGFVIPSSWFQSLNPIFIILFAPIMSTLWVFLANKGKNPSNPYKFAIALSVLGFGFLALVWGSWSIPQGASVASVSMVFIILSYFLQTLAELCLSPIGLSAVNKLTPPKFYSIMFGVWFFSTAIGNYISGALGGLIEEITNEYSLSYFFMITTWFAFGASIIAFIFSKKLNTMMHGIK